LREFCYFYVVFWIFKSEKLLAHASGDQIWLSAVQSFRRRVWRHLVGKSGHSLSIWMHYRVLFHMVWRVATYGGRLFFFPLFSLSWHVKYTIVLSFFFDFDPHSCNSFIFFCFKQKKFIFQNKKIFIFK